jgi:hypothetical protein
MGKKNIVGFDLVKIVKTFELTVNEPCEHLQEWLSATTVLTPAENEIVDDLYDDIMVSGEYMNEEELKARMVGLLFYAAKVDVPKKIRVFYERPLAAKIKNLDLAVICDCMVATPILSTPDKPYFFLQEFKKAKGEKKDPEAQMLTAMIIAQAQNADGKPVYGSYIIGTTWHFTTLIDQNYCVSKKYEATYKDKLFEIICILRKLKDLILNR